MPPTRPAPDLLIKSLGAFDATIQRLALAARAAVIREAPDAAEEIGVPEGGVSITFSFTGDVADAFVYVSAAGEQVELGFSNGASLPDPHKKLLADGGKKRKVKLVGAIDLRDPYLVGLVQAAMAKAPRVGDTKSAAKKAAK